MFLIDTPSAVAGQFVGGTPQIGQAATQVSPDWLNAIQNEIAAVILGAGVALDKPTSTQLRDAINTKIGALITARQATTVAPGIAELATSVETIAGTDTARVVTPKGLADALASLVASVSALQATVNALSPHVIPILGGVWLAKGGYDATRYLPPINQILNRADWPEAWTAIKASGMLAANGAAKAANKTLYGPGDGATTFQMPDMRDVVLRVWKEDLAGGLGPGLGGFKANQNKAHTHQITTNMHDGTGDGNIADSDGTETPHVSTTQSSGGDEACMDHTSVRFVIRMK